LQDNVWHKGFNMCPNKGFNKGSGRTWPGEGKQDKGGLFRENPFGPKTCQGKPLRGNVFDIKNVPDAQKENL